MSEKSNASDQGELFQAETTWFHVFKDMIDSGDVRKMGPTTTTVYLVIKAHTNFSTGRAFPSIDTIGEKTGLSFDTINRSIKALTEMGYITKEKMGRSNVYTLREKVSIKGEGGAVAMATWDYLPTGVKAAVADLKNILMSPDLEGSRVVHIEHLQVNIQTGANPVINAPHNMYSGGLPKMPNPKLQKQLDDLMEAVLAAETGPVNRSEKE